MMTNSGSKYIYQQSEPNRRGYNQSLFPYIAYIVLYSVLKQEDKPCELLARPIQTGNRIASRTAVPGRHVRTAHADALKMPGAAHRTKPGRPGRQAWQIVDLSAFVSAEISVRSP